MTLLLLGNTGQLGWELQRSLHPLGEVIALDYPDVNMADPASISKTVQDQHPRVIINATAYTAVDKAESEPELAMAINGTGPAVLAEEAKKLDAVLFHFSTDYIFDGTKSTPYVETDQPHPLNVYGESKLAGERAIQSVEGNFLILRTAWVYSLRRDGFVTRLLGWARKNETLRIVDDQISNPTWASMLAETTALLIARAGEHFLPWLAERKGLYHLTGDGFTSRYDWAKEILRLDPAKEEQKVKELLPARTSDFPTPARRPLFTALDCKKFEDAFDFRLPPWSESLHLALDTQDHIPKRTPQIA
jgi:dTDP-4-dehydrorhamnose reductase